MDSQEAIDLGRNALWMAVLIGSPALIAALVVGLIVGVLQSITQVQEQTVSFVPKLVAVVIVISFTLPWLIGQLVQYSHDLIANIPTSLG